MTREAKIDIKKYTDPATDPTKFKSISEGIEFEGLRDALENFKEQEPEIVNNITEFADQFGGQENAVKKFGAITGAMADLNLRLSGEPSTPSTSDISPGDIYSTPSIQLPERKGEVQVADASGNLPGIVTPIPKAPSVQVDPGDTQKVVLPWGGKPVDTQMTALNRGTTLVEDESKVPTEPYDYGSQVTGDPFDPLNIPPSTLRTVAYPYDEVYAPQATGVEPTVPGAGGGSLLNAINYRGPYREGGTRISEDIYNLTGDLGPELLNNTSLSKEAGMSNNIIRSIIGLGIGKVDAERIGKLVQSVILGGPSPVDTANKAVSIIKNAKNMSPIQIVNATNFALNTFGKIAKDFDNINKDSNFFGILGDWAQGKIDNITNAGSAIKNIVFNPREGLERFGDSIKFGNGYMKIEQKLVNGSSTTLYDRKGKVAKVGLDQLGPVGWMIGMTPVGSFKSLSDMTLGAMGAFDEASQNAWDLQAAVMTGGHEVTIKDDPNIWEETNVGIYSNSGKAGEGNQYANIALDVPNETNYPSVTLQISNTVDMKISDLKDVHINEMVGQVAPWTGGANPEARISQIKNQLIATGRQLGLKGDITTTQLAAAIAEKSARSIGLHNSSLNKISRLGLKGEDLIDPENAHRVSFSDMAKARVSYNKYFGYIEEEEAEEGRAMQEYTPSPAPVQKQAPPRVVPQSSDEPEPAYSPAEDYGETISGGGEFGGLGWARGGLVR